MKFLKEWHFYNCCLSHFEMSPQLLHLSRMLLLDELLFLGNNIVCFYSFVWVTDICMYLVF